MTRVIYYACISMLFLSGCTVKKDQDDLSFLGKLYHNTTAKYNGYYNADLLMQESIAALDQEYAEDYDTLIPVYPYMANTNVENQYKTLDKIIEKVTTVSALHRQSHWLDDNYLMLGKANFLKKNFKEANASFQYLVTNFNPVSPNESAREIKETRARGKRTKASFKQQKKEREKRRKEINKRRKQEQKKSKKRRGKKQRPDRSRENEPAKEQTIGEDSPLLASANAKPEPPSGGGLLSSQSNPENYFMGHSPVYQEGLLWEARTWTAQENYFSAEARLSMIINDPNAAEDIRNQAYVALIDSYVKSRKYDRAIQTIDLALDRNISKDRKIRLAFLAGQLAAKSNENQKAIAYFEKVRQLKPSYEKNFYAQLFTAKIQGGDLIGKFQDLLNNPNNAKYKGQIYYTMGEAYRSNYDFSQAIEAYKKVVDPEYETSAITQAKSYVAIADIYFNQSEYRQAKKNYDGSLGLLNNAHRDYARAKERSAMLTKIASAEEIIHLQDSLLVISQYTDEQKKALALRIKKDAEKEGRQASGQGSASSPSAMTGLQSASQRGGPGAAQSSFFAYDEKSLKDGKRTFEREWGGRSLEDNWRYGSSGFSTRDEENASSGQSLTFGITQTEIEEILQNVPNTPEEVESVNAKINQAMLSKGFSLRSDLNQIEKSNEVLIRLIDRSPGMEIAAEATFLLYLNAKESGNTALANDYKRQFDSQFGKTDFSDKIRRSSTMMGVDDVAESALEQVEKNYNNGDFEKVLELTEKSKTLFKDRKNLMPQFALFEALATGKTEGREAYIEKLQYLVANFSDSREASQARDFLQVLGAEVKTDITSSSASSKDVFNDQIDNTPHYILVAVESNDEVNPLKASISDFNKEYFQNENMTISTVQISTAAGREPALLIRRFDNKENAMEYYRIAEKNLQTFAEGHKVSIFPLAISNYRFLITENKMDDYKIFLKEIYGITI